MAVQNGMEREIQGLSDWNWSINDGDPFHCYTGSSRQLAIYKSIVDSLHSF